MTAQLALAVRDFVRPLEPTGSLDASLSWLLEEDAAALGLREHGRIQARLVRAHPGAQREVAVQARFLREDFEVLVRGRVDLLLPGPEPVVEEIKTTFRLPALRRALAADPGHPFARQARLYAWILGRQGGPPSRCRLRVVSLLDGAEELLDLDFDAEAVGAWAEAQVDGLHQRHQRACARAAERRALAARLDFPFADPRPGQEDLVARVQVALDAATPLLLQAPTGLGKTAGVLYPALRKALAEDLRVFHGTPRNSQHGVAEAFLRRLRAAGMPVRFVTLRAKEKVCPQPAVHCHPESCPRAAGYYDRLRSSGALERLAEAGCADAEAVRAEADAHQLCPFELALDAGRAADVLIGDYNYALAPASTLQRFFGEGEAGRNLLLIDEAHNLPERAAGWFSPALDLARLATLKRAWPGRRTGLKAAFGRQLGRCLDLLGRHAGAHRQVTPDPAAFAAEELRIRRLLARAAGEGVEPAPDHPLAQLARDWSAFCAVLREPSDALLATWIPPGRLQLTCVDASAHLAARFTAAAGVVCFSATLKPFAHYARRLGLAQPASAEVGSPYPAENRLLLLVPQISTRLRRREAEAPRIAAFLERVLALRRGNYLVAFPSYAFLEAVRPRLALPGFEVLAQPRGAAAADLEGILAALRTRQGVVVLAVQGGSLAEGIDLPGEALIGCVVVGPPVPPPDLERRLARAYFDRAGEAGEACTCTYPAMARAVQAAGRVIRGPGERGLLAFLDDRFLAPEFARCFPADWFRDSPREAVSRAILADVAAFWDRP